jgi:hypothetical protein
MGFYHTAQVCTNGHTVTSSIENSSSLMADFCMKCGAATVYQCGNCLKPIRGYYKTPGVISIHRYTAPNFCYGCGKPYPWMSAQIDTAKELAEELEDLTEIERAKLKSAIDDIVVESPRSELAATRIKKILDTISGTIGDTFQKIVVQIAAETVKKQFLS